ncbi:MAG: hypothetical protein F7C07_04900 [Desulfurococcales archaeon]|nr:hypothetical protein [Desulfurococcales archaeon]
MSEDDSRKREEREEKPKPPRPEGGISKLLEVIPSASALRARETRLSEKRIRLKYDETLEESQARISPSLARMLGIEDKIEIVVAGRHRFLFRAIIDENVEENRVHVNPGLMEEHGIADNSIATVRPYKGTERLGVRLSV